MTLPSESSNAILCGAPSTLVHLIVYSCPYVTESVGFVTPEIDSGDTPSHPDVIPSSTNDGDSFCWAYTILPAPRTATETPAPAKKRRRDTIEVSSLIGRHLQVCTP